MLHDAISVEAGFQHAATNWIHASWEQFRLRSAGYSSLRGSVRPLHSAGTLRHQTIAENASDDKKAFYIDPRNMITASYLNFARKCSRDIVTNCRAHISKTKTFDK